MTRRARALAFGAAALGCAGLAAAIAGGYRADVAASYGELRPVVVANETLAAGRPLRPEALARWLEVRRVPERFAPPGTLTDPADAVGLAPQAEIAAGSYVLASQLGEPQSPRAGRAPGAGPGRSPVEIAVSGAGSIGGRAGRRPSRVDVVVTTEPGPGPRRGRTYVAVRGVRLLDLRSADGELEPAPGPGTAAWIATLALTREQALRLIQAESFARQVRVIERR